MKKILITGKNSYIGTSLENWMKKDPKSYTIETIDMRKGLWKEIDFSEYDVIFHVAGIAHVSYDPKLKDLYFEVNRDLAIDTAMKAKTDGVRQFIFMSSIIVYGESDCNKRVIDRKTKPVPSNFYGESKFQAEEGIFKLADKNYKTVILRPPMIYGKGSKGNYPKLAKVAKEFPVFPDFDNERSMLHIDNLCEFIKIMIDQEEAGLFFPQNKEYVKTSAMVKLVAEVYGKKIRLIRVFNPLITIMASKVKLISRVFGNLVYEKSMSVYEKANYQIRDFEESIKLTESRD